MGRGVIGGSASSGSVGAPHALIAVTARRGQQAAAEEPVRRVNLGPQRFSQGSPLNGKLANRSAMSHRLTAHLSDDGLIVVV